MKGISRQLGFIVAVMLGLVMLAWMNNIGSVLGMHYGSLDAERAQIHLKVSYEVLKFGLLDYSDMDPVEIEKARTAARGLMELEEKEPYEKAVLPLRTQVTAEGVEKVLQVIDGEVDVKPFQEIYFYCNGWLNTVSPGSIEFAADSQASTYYYNRE